MKFIAIYGMPAAAMAEMMKNSTPEQQKAGMQKWNDWAAAHADKIEIGNAVGKNLRVTKEGSSMVSNEVGGYSFVEADSAEAAAALFKDSPHFDMPNSYIEIMPVVKM